MKIPITLSSSNKRLNTIGIVDSGSNFMLIPKDIADVLELKIGNKQEDAEGIGGSIKTARSLVNLSVTNGQNTIHLRSIPVQVLLECELKEILRD